MLSVLRRNWVLFAVYLAACGGPSKTHGTLTDMSRVKGNIVFCSHQVPNEVCTRDNPQLIPQFKKAHDWCDEHDVPESQCFECHPDLTFEPLPVLDAAADIQWLSREGEDVPDLAPHAVKGKVTVFDFYADWCASCRKVDGYVYRRLAEGDPTLAVRKINIVTWETPVAKRYMTNVPALPYLVIYGPSGKLAETVYSADLKALERAIEKAARK